MKTIDLKNNQNFIFKFLDIPLMVKEENPISKFFITFSVLIKIILNLPLFTKYLFKFIEYIHKILYEEDKIIFIEIQKEASLSFYFYLDLLIKYEEDIVNYEYSIEFIEKIDQMEINIDKNFFYRIIKSKIVLDLISNFRETNFYSDRYEEEINRIKKNNINTIKEFAYIFPNNKINLNEKDIFNKNLDEIYYEIINSLIRNKQFKDYYYTINILKQLDIENIDLSLLMYNEISKELNKNENYIQEQKILTKEDLFSEDKINFHYILLKFIFKNSIYIYNIPFITKSRENILKIIKAYNIFEDLSLMTNDDLKEKLKFIVKIYSDSDYYYSIFLKDKNINDINANINENVIQQSSNLSSAKTTEENIDKLKGQTDRQIIDEKENEKKSKMNSQSENKIPYLILNKCTIKIHTNERGKEPYIIYDNICIGEKDIQIDYNNLISFEDSNDNSILIQNYKLFLKFLRQFENIIKNNFKYNYKLEIKLEFKRNNINKKPAYDIECKYTFYIPEKGKENISFKDENILNNLKNENSLGLNLLSNEMNNESYKDIKYHDIFHITSTIKNENESSKQFTIEENKIDDKINNNFTKKLSSIKDNFASEEKVLEFKETKYKHEKSCDFIFQLSDGTLVSGGKDNTLVIYVERLNKKIEMNLEQYPYSISEKISDNEYTVEMILCCEKNFILIKLNTEDYSYNIETLLLPNICSFYCCELTKGNFIISGESTSINIINLFDETKEKKIINEFVHEKTYFCGIKINEDIVALTSNRVIPNGDDKLIFYNLESKKISVEIKGFSFNYSFTSLSLISINKNKLHYNILLCACKRYYSKQKNGILLVNSQIEDCKEIESTFYPTNNFEVHCFCQILNIKKNDNDNSLNDSQCDVEYEETNYFFVGGFDENKREGKVKLYKVIYDLKASLTKIKYLQDIEFEENKDFDRFESPISSIIQSKLNGKIVISCWDGNVYLFSIPNIDFYLNEDK